MTSEEYDRIYEEVNINCPDCGEYLYQQGKGFFDGRWLDECPKCGWPAPDLVVGGENDREEKEPAVDSRVRDADV
jgi:ssDNA-binding Zn-finger/Zn-ribbon topoisomerase 1